MVGRLGGRLVHKGTSPQQRARGRWVTALASVTLTASIMLTGAACTGASGGATGSGPHTPGRPTSGTARSEAYTAVPVRLLASSAPVTVADGLTPSEVSVQVSRALFAAAPVVVVAPAADAGLVRRAAWEASQLGVPMLLVDGASGAASATGTVASDPASLTRAAAEISRLRAERVLAMGSSLAPELARDVEVPVLADPARLPAVGRAAPVSSVAVLLQDRGGGGRDTLSSAVAASAAAAGAIVIPVAGGDVRSDPKAIEQLAARKPARVLAVGREFGPVDQLARRVAVAKTGVELPGGGQVLFPGRRLVALYGHPGTGALGVLGEQDLDASIARAKKMAASYQPLSTVPVVPAFEIIATVADSAPGPDGDYSSESAVAALRPWVEKAGREGLYVVLDLQPGRAKLLDQAKRYAPLLKLPYVGLALDPEWQLTATQRPLQQVGGVDAAEINAVSAWLSDLAGANQLPQKLLVLHQFRLSMIRHEHDLDLHHDNVQILIHMDGQGGQPDKDATWRSVTRAAPKQIPFGWKNFYDEDHPMLTPAQTMTKKPAPLMISYQ